MIKSFLKNCLDLLDMNDLGMEALSLKLYAYLLPYVYFILQDTIAY